MNNAVFNALLLQPDFRDGFWAQVARADEGCWVWTGPRDRKGYGRIYKRLHGRRATTGAHRIAYALGTGCELPEQLVLHRCDNPPCCRPDHLFVGTHADNFDDSREKCRNGFGDRHGTRRRPESVARGERHWSAKLTADIVHEIRRRVGAGETQRAVAASLGVSKQRVSAIVNRKSWAHED